MLPCRAIVLANRCSRLHRVANQAVIDQLHTRDMVRILERGIRCRKIAKIPVVASVVWNLIEDSWRASLQRTLHIAGSASYSTATAVAASRASARVSATTN